MSEEEVIDLEAIGAKFEDKGYFRRLFEMFSGLGKPHDTPEYKQARLELQRQAAPLIAIVSVALFFAVLIVMTALKPEKEDSFEIQRAEEEQEQEPQQEEEKETPEDPPDTVPEEITTPTDTVVNAPSLSDVAAPTAMTPEAFSPQPAPADTVAMVKSPISMKSMAGSRDPGRVGSLTGGGDRRYGSPATEAAVLKVLWWLKATQKTDPNNPERGYWAGGSSQLANTALAVLTYLAHGESPNSESPYSAEFGPVVQKALNWLIADVTQGSTPLQTRMRHATGNEYDFLIATYALCEAYGMTKNPEVKDAAMLALERIVQGQSPTGGWDYKIDPKSDRDDVSFAGWALQALKAGKLAGLHPDGFEECIKKAIKCLQTRNFKQGGFNYIAKNGNATGLTATGCLAMQLLGYGDKPEVKSALDWMKDWVPTFEAGSIDPNKPKGVGGSPQYYCYYATQCKFQAGLRKGATKSDEQNWVAWNAAMQKLYPSSITDLPDPVMDRQGKPHKQGYYTNKDAHSTRPVMDTCLAALQLMVYYRYLPQGVLEADDGDSPAPVKKDKDEVQIEFDDI